MKNEKACGTIAFNEKGEILIIQQRSGSYGFPKGRMEAGETEVETAIRETKEETNVDVVVDEEKRFSVKYMTNKHTKKEVIYFIAKSTYDKDMRPQESEVKKVMWVNRKDVMNILTFDDLKNIWLKVLTMQNKR